MNGSTLKYLKMTTVSGVHTYEINLKPKHTQRSP
uniref:Uncharacterized protein n=1 Tax=Tetranychus urticae TaxID=32264 RepID=T1KNC5_TETUR